jgi:hypothetical protein
VIDLDGAMQRINDLSGEVDNVYTDVRYRAPMAELARLSRQLVAELRAAREFQQTVWAALPVIWKKDDPHAEVFRRISEAYVAGAAYDKVTGEGS